MVHLKGWLKSVWSRWTTKIAKTSLPALVLSIRGTMGEVIHKADSRVLQIANFFVKKGVEVNDPVSHLKLQKLLYIAYGWYLLLFNKQLFKDRMEAWQYGPVVPTLYHVLKAYGGGAILQPIDSVPDLDPVNDADLIKYLEGVWKAYGVYSAMKLTEYSHAATGPWGRIYRAFAGRIPNNITIEDGDVRDFFQAERARLTPQVVERTLMPA